MSIDKKKIKEIVENYIGGPVKSIECIPDPMSPGYTAIRAIFPDNCTMHLLHNSNIADQEDSIEEVEFEKWPPTSNKKNMFKIENMNVMIAGG